MTQALAAVDLPGFAGRFYQELSGGRAASGSNWRGSFARYGNRLTRAAHAGCFLDEPVSSLDIQHQIGVMELAADYARRMAVVSSGCDARPQPDGDVCRSGHALVFGQGGDFGSARNRHERRGAIGDISGAACAYASNRPTASSSCSLGHGSHCTDLMRGGAANRTVAQVMTGLLRPSATYCDQSIPTDCLVSPSIGQVMIRHIVHLRFAENVSEADKLSIYDQLAALSGHIDGILDFQHLQKCQC